MELRLGGATSTEMVSRSCRRPFIDRMGGCTVDRRHCQSTPPQTEGEALMINSGDHALPPDNPETGISSPMVIGM
jgi:hypothetical protein